MLNFVHIVVKGNKKCTEEYFWHSYGPNKDSVRHHPMIRTDVLWCHHMEEKKQYEAAYVILCNQFFKYKITTNASLTSIDGAAMRMG